MCEDNLLLDLSFCVSISVQLNCIALRFLLLKALVYIGFLVHYDIRMLISLVP